MIQKLFREWGINEMCTILNVFISNRVVHSTLYIISSQLRGVFTLLPPLESDTDLQGNKRVTCLWDKGCQTVKKHIIHYDLNFLVLVRMKRCASQYRHNTKIYRVSKEKKTGWQIMVIEVCPSSFQYLGKLIFLDVENLR